MNQTRYLLVVIALIEILNRQVTAEELAMARSTYNMTSKSYIVIVEHGNERHTKIFSTREEADKFVNRITYDYFVGDRALGIRVRLNINIVER